jgi:hypothetical protein
MPAVFAVAALTACSTCGHSGPPPEARRDLGDTSAAAPDAAPYLAMARAIVEHRGRAAVASPPQAPGRRVFLVLWPDGGSAAPLVATATGATLADAVAAAAESIAAKAQGGGGRLELDVASSVAGATLGEDLEVPLVAVGLEGFLAIRDDGKTGFVLPGEIVQRGMFQTGKRTTLDQDKITRLLAARAELVPSDLAPMRSYRFGVHAYVESPGHDRTYAVMRGMVEHPVQVTPELLVSAVRRGADYLARVMNDEGRYLYEYHPVDDRDDTTYGWLRHAGTTYALLEAYEELGTSSYVQKAERALSALETRLHDDAATQGKYLLDTNDEEQQKSGGGGLALLAYAKHAAVTGKRIHLETMRALARFIVAQQYADGHFRSNVDLERETGKKLKREVIYYTGEATLALMRLYALDAQPAYLETARKAADWVVQVRDAYVSEDNQEHDHWMSYAFNDLYRVTRDEAYLEHAYKIARAIQKKQCGASDAPAPDMAGTFYEGQTTPASTRVEAYDADISASRFAGRPEAWLLGPAREAAASMLGQQFDVANDYWLKNQAKADGGVRESLFVHDVRIDYVQHAMSAWLHLARLLRDAEYGKTGVPSQDSVRDTDVEQSAATDAGIPLRR